MSKDSIALRLRPIAEMLDEEFFVPSYQRGYRWAPKQVTALLDDLEAFLFSDPPRDSYYCLQPVVVRRRNDGSWELVDGQQRLTTIYLLLGCLSDVALLLGKKPFRLRYGTREGSAGYLAAPDPTLASTNVDYHHMYRAREAIADWFDSRDGSARVDLLKCLTLTSNSSPPYHRRPAPIAGIAALIPCRGASSTAPEPLLESDRPHRRATNPPPAHAGRKERAPLHPRR